jgi:hypothetical protein
MQVNVSTNFCSEFGVEAVVEPFKFRHYYIIDGLGMPPTRKELKSYGQPCNYFFCPYIILGIEPS